MSQFPLNFYEKVSTLKEFLEVHVGAINCESKEFEEFLEDVVVAECDEECTTRMKNAKENLDNVCWLRSKNVKQVQKILDKQAYIDLVKTKTKSIFEKFGGMGWIQRTGPYADQLWKYKSKNKTSNRNVVTDNLEVENEELYTDREREQEMEMPFTDEEFDAEYPSTFGLQMEEMNPEEFDAEYPSTSGLQMEETNPESASEDHFYSDIEAEFQSWSCLPLEVINDEIKYLSSNLPPSPEWTQESVGSGLSVVPPRSLEERVLREERPIGCPSAQPTTKLFAVQKPLVPVLGKEALPAIQEMTQESDVCSRMEVNPPENAENSRTESLKRKSSTGEELAKKQKVELDQNARSGTCSVHAGNEGQIVRRKKTKRGKRAKKSRPNIYVPSAPATALIQLKEPPELIGRKWILYSKDLREPINVSETCKHHFASGDIKELIAKIFGLSDFEELKQLQSIDVDKFIQLMELFIKNEKKFAYKLSLAHHCPVVISDAPENMEGLLKQDSSHNQVYQFLRAVCHKVFPKDLLGCAQNCRLFEKRMKTMITAGINDRIKVAWFLNNFKAKTCSWLFCTSESSRHENLLTHFLHWMVTYLLYVMRAYFYITDTSTQKFMMVFYRKCLWKKIDSAAMNELISTDKVAEVPQELLGEAEFKMQGTVRFKPKPTTVRSVVIVKPKTYKDDVKSLAAVLQYLQEHNSELKGSSKFDPYEIHEAWKKFHASLDLSKKVYAVTIDLKDCFGSINQGLLLDLVHTLPKFEGNIFRVQKFSVLIKTGDTIRKKTVCKGSPKLTGFEEYLLTECINRYPNGAVFIDQSHEENLYLYLWTHFLHSYIMESVIQIGNKLINLKQGISQGGVLSTCLCNMYVGVYEKGLLGDLGQVPGELMMRSTDDFFFLTQNLKRADSFVYQMMNGIPEFNLHPNPSKIVTNFPSSTPEVKALSEGERMKWNGMEIDPNTLSLYVEYSQFQNISVQYTLAVGTNLSGIDMKKKLLSHMNLPPLLIDSELIGKTAVIQNISKKFDLTARRFHCLIMNYPPNLRNRNPLFLLGIVQREAVRFFVNSQFAMKKLGLEFSISMNEVFWLCFATHETILRKYPAVYPDLLRMLKTKIRFYESKLKETNGFQQLMEALRI